MKPVHCLRNKTRNVLRRCLFKVLLWRSNGIHARHYREQNAENKTGKLSQGTRLKLAISCSQITSTSSMLVHSRARFWAPIAALIFHISLSDRLLLRKDAGFGACCASWQIPIPPDEIWIGRRQGLKTSQQDTNVLFGLTRLDVTHFCSARKIKRCFLL